MKKKDNYQLLSTLNLKKSPICEKLQESTSRLLYTRKTYDLSSFSAEEQNKLYSLYSSLKNQPFPIIPFISVELKGNNLITLRAFQHDNLREFSIKKFEKMDHKKRKNFLKELFFSLVEVSHHLKENFPCENCNIKPENILISSEIKILYTDPLKLETSSKINEFELLQIVQIFIEFFSKGLFLKSKDKERIFLYENRCKLPKGLYELLYIASEPDIRLSLPLKEFFKMVLYHKKMSNYKSNALEKEALENEAFGLRKGVIHQGWDLAVLWDRLDEKKEMLEEAGDYFLDIEKGLFQKTIKENNLKIENRILDSKVKMASIIHNKNQESFENELDSMKNTLKETIDQSTKQTLKSYALGDLEPGIFQRTTFLKGHKGKIFSLVSFQDSYDFHYKICSGSNDKSLILWDLFSLDSILTIPNAHQGPINRLSFCHRNKWLYSGSDDKQVKIWDLQQKKNIQSICGSKGPIYTIQPFEKSPFLAFAGSDPRIFLYSEERNKVSGFLQGHTSSIWSLMLLYEETTLVSASSDTNIKIWDLETKHCLQNLSGHSKDVLTVGSLLDEGLIISGSMDETIRFWDPASGECVNLIYEGHKGIKDIIKLKENYFGCLNGDGVNIYDIRQWKKIEGIKGKCYGGLGYFEKIGCLAVGVEDKIKLMRET